MQEEKVNFADLIKKKKEIDFAKLIRKKKPKISFSNLIKKRSNEMPRPPRKFEEKDRFNGIINHIKENGGDDSFMSIYLSCSNFYSSSVIDSRLDLFSDLHHLVSGQRLSKRFKISDGKRIFYYSVV